MKSGKLNFVAVAIIFALNLRMLFLLNRTSTASCDQDNKIVLREKTTPSNPQSTNVTQDQKFRIQYPLLFGCHNMDDIQLVSPLGNGISKIGFLGLYSGHEVVVRMTNIGRVESEECLIKTKKDTVHFNKTAECLRMGAVRLLKEIVTLQQLDHPSIIKLLGYCARSEEVRSTKLNEHGVIVVSEYGHVLNNTVVATWSLKQRLEKAIELMDFFLYLEHSPLGSIEYPDFKLWHFVLVNNRIKAIDFDGATSLEPLCPDQPNVKCIFNLPCVEGRCHGYNAKMNMWRFNGTFSSLLFPSTYFVSIPKLASVVQRLKQNDISAWELKETILSILHEYFVSM